MFTRINLDFWLLTMATTTTKNNNRLPSTGGATRTGPPRLGTKPDPANVFGEEEQAKQINKY